ncbi:hypothetical protein R1sor_010437 [Riccia sorocarpa]|uniref:Uncharacterized protein n=1 Tax=Riccia sorocarpa TaxID=122646 RepID=A0ABD3HZG8_9MARC
MAHESQITFLGIFNISKFWGPSGGHLTYAGCGFKRWTSLWTRHCCSCLKRPRFFLSQFTEQYSRPQVKGSFKPYLHQFVYSRLSSSSWAIIVIGKPTARGNLKAVSFSRVELTSPAVPVESAQGQVGVVKVRDSSRGKESAEPSSTSGPRPRASLLAMLRLQVRLDDMRKDIAEAITALKLEQEEEFVDSNCDWVESL